MPSTQNASSSKGPTTVLLQISNIPEQSSFQEVKKAFDNLLLFRKRDVRIQYTLTLAQGGTYEGQRNGGAGIIELSSNTDARILTSRIQRPEFKIRGNVIYFAAMSGSLAKAPRVFNNFFCPRIKEEARLKKEESLFKLKHRVRVCKVQFGVLGRKPDELFIEWEGDYDPESLTARIDTDKRIAFLSFEDTRDEDNPRSIQIEMGGHSDDFLRRVTIPMQHIKSLSIAYDFGQPFVHMVLHCPPSFEIREQWRASCGNPVNDKRQSWRRLMALDAAHERVVPFASRSLRIVFTRDSQHLENFMEMSKYVRLPTLKQSDAENIYKTDLFSPKELRKFDQLIASLPWIVAFQCEALLRNCLLTTPEIFSLEKDIRRLLKFSTRHAAEVLRLYVSLVGGVASSGENINSCFKRAERECNERGSDEALVSPPLGTFECRHITVTPTSFLLQGPDSEQSNRVIRRYGSEFEEYFLRVAFADEGGFRYRSEFDVKTHDFIRERVGSVLKGGLTVANRNFEFLAYSSSSLGKHSVWFVSPFEHPVYGYVTAEAIRTGLGDFSGDIRKPARYAARISQAFSSTDPTVTVQPHEIVEKPDIVSEDGKEFTDGVGTISPMLADEIWEKLKALRPLKSREHLVKPSAYQIRLGGYKGVVSVDYSLKGRLICPRKSMKKFEAFGSLDIEIAKAFDQPGSMYLNRPLIMLLETLGVKHHAFIALQDVAMEQAKEALKYPDSTAMLLELHGIGSAYKLPSLLHRLESYGLTQLHAKDVFIRRILNYSLYHVKRELKNHTRIPVIDSWTLVGVADEYSVLEEGEIYACVSRAGKPPIYLEGDCMISRSPTIHPGDVQNARAIGRPRRGLENLVNCVVFATKGSRPLPSCLGGGDLDGDEYCLVMLPDLHPPKYDTAAPYESVEHHQLDRPSTINDIADFVVEYINSDVVGIIATNHLMLADQRPECARDKDCLELAKLHSAAVDYKKTGTRVSLERVPKPAMKPDWRAGELNDPGNGDYYESDRVLGVLFRRIELEPPEVMKTRSREPIPPEEAIQQQSVVEIALHPKLQRYLAEANLEEHEQEFAKLLSRYSCELKYQCVTHTVSRSPHARLTEEEVVAGIILEQTHQPDKRKDMMTKLREQSNDLIYHVKAVISGDPNTEWTETDRLIRWLTRAWVALRVGYKKEKQVYGARSFQIIALGAVLDALDSLEALRIINAME